MVAGRARHRGAAARSRTGPDPLRSLRGRGRWLAAYAFLEISIPFPLIARRRAALDSSLAAIIIASVPLLVAVLALRFDRAERATGSRLVGLLVGFTGVVVLVGIDVAGQSDELLGAAFILIASLGYAAGPMVLRRHLSDLDQRAVMGVSLAIAAVFLTPVTAVGAARARRRRPTRCSRIVVLGLLCTAAAFVVFGRLIAEIGPGRALVITYVNPVVALALGMAVLGERPGAGAIAGLLLILAGSWLSTDGRLPPGCRACSAAPGVLDEEVQRLRIRERVAARRLLRSRCPAGSS